MFLDTTGFSRVENLISSLEVTPELPEIPPASAVWTIQFSWLDNQLMFSDTTGFSRVGHSFSWLDNQLMFSDTTGFSRVDHPIFLAR